MVLGARIAARRILGNFKLFSRQLQREELLLVFTLSIVLGQFYAHRLFTAGEIRVSLAVLGILTVILLDCSPPLATRWICALAVFSIAFAQQRTVFPSEPALAWFDRAYAADPYRRGRFQRATVVLRADVVSEPQALVDGGRQFLLRMGHVLAGPLLVQVTAADVPWLPISSVRRGDRVELAARVQATTQAKPWFVEPFSYQGRLARRGVVAYGKVKEVVEIVSKREQAVSPSRLDALYDRFDGSDAVAVLFAMTMGDRSVIGRDLGRLFQRLGVSHVLVVSGFHVAAIYGLVFSLMNAGLRRCSRVLCYVSADVVSSCAGVLAVSTYLLVVPPAIPVLRAVLVLAFCAFGTMLARKAVSFRTLLLSLCLVVLVVPGALFEVGTQLTYSALLGLLCAAKWVTYLKYRYRNSRGAIAQIRSYFLYPLVFCSFAWLFTLPLVAYAFRILVPLAPLFNVILVPFLSLVFLLFGGPMLIAYSLKVPGSMYCTDLVLGVADIILRVLYSVARELEALGLGARNLSAKESVEVSLYAALCTLVMLSTTMLLQFPPRGRSLT